MRRAILFTVALCLLASRAQSADAYFVRFDAIGQSTGSGNVLWLDDILFFNTNDVPATVTFLDVSNGPRQAATPPLTLPPRQTVSLNAKHDVGGKWRPAAATPLWILHLDVPTGVIVESRDEFYVIFGIPELFPAARGKVSMPVFRDLRPANEQQVHLGTDLSGTASHVNVGVYNAGSEPALATIEVRRTCDDTVIDSRSITVPANTVIQTVGLRGEENPACPSTNTPSWVRAVTIIVSQPSLTFVSNVSENAPQPPGEAGSVPVVGLAVTKNERF
jgi:hypothetical protein